MKDPSGYCEEKTGIWGIRAEAGKILLQLIRNQTVVA